MLNISDAASETEPGMKLQSSAPEGAASLKKPASAAERKQAERDRKREQGFIKVEVWVRPQDADRVRKYAGRLSR